MNSAQEEPSRGGEPSRKGNRKRLRRFGFHIKGRRPERLINATYVPQGPTDIRMRLRIMALSLGSFVGNKKLIECYLNDNRVHVAVMTESDVTKAKIREVALSNYSIANRSCNTEEGVKGGRGGWNPDPHTRQCLLRKRI